MSSHENTTLLSYPGHIDPEENPMGPHSFPGKNKMTLNIVENYSEWGQKVFVVLFRVIFHAGWSMEQLFFGSFLTGMSFSV